MTDQDKVLTRRGQLKLLGDACNEMRRVRRLVIVQHLGNGDLNALSAQSFGHRPPGNG